MPREFQTHNGNVMANMQPLHLYALQKKIQALKCNNIAGVNKRTCN
jgi:hypothetical protein